MKQAIEQAMCVVHEKSKVLNSRWRLNYHFMPPAQWMNDPNGFCYYKGKYHLFYQHHPFGVTTGQIFWGHASSSDCLHWHHEPIAIAPSEYWDQDGCFSGTAITHPETEELFLFYTGHRWIDQEADTFEEVQNVATSSDGVNFTKQKERPLSIEVPSDSTHHIRDPKVWYEKSTNTYHMLLGNRSKDDIGRVLHYTSKSMYNWTESQIANESDGTLGYMWECPDYFNLENKHVLLFSPQGVKEQGEKYKNYNQTGYIFTNLSGESIGIHQFEELDFGHDLYAAQSTTDETGRTLLIAWMDMWESPMPTQADGWCGAMTLPRELVIGADNRIWMKPIREWRTLIAESNINLLPQVQQGVQLDTCAQYLSFHSADNFEWSLTTDNGYVLVQRKDGQFKVERHYPQHGFVNDFRQRTIVERNDCTEVELFVDQSSIEVFINCGQYVFTSRIYPNGDSYRMRLTGDVTNFMNHKLGSIW